MPQHKGFTAHKKRSHEVCVVKVQEAEGCDISSNDIQQYPIAGQAEIEHESALSTLRSNVKFPSKFWMDATNEGQGDKAYFRKVSDIGLYSMVTHCINVNSDLTWQVLVHKTRVVYTREMFSISLRIEILSLVSNLLKRLKGHQYVLEILIHILLKL